ncbi:amino acid adenylation domain-containing protein [Micromonospora sp. WMMD998]|uniref:non-ribosomal peptide synthetase n=1 Tax=Micromonospora sp. WMMD998 TaxID=3016092 RepID=UPI00249C43A5|nr:amino acid adenylation domain-containing protein [Micromonospora sp. WMMD998]WFE39914.1 amino acid adenylation domain-containing protein [Micromonospora sp. WMMD998]
MDIAATAVTGRTPASRKEAALWLLERLVPDSAPNNLTLAFQVEGRLDEARLTAALRAIFARYETLRTVYHSVGSTLEKEVVAPGDFDVPLERLPDGDPQVFVVRPFTFDGRPLVRAGMRRDADGDVVCLAFHHLVYDIISGSIILADLIRAYDALATSEPLPAELRAEVPSFTEAEPAAESVEFWRTELAGYDPAALGLACGAPDADQPSLRGDQVTHRLSAATREIVRRLPKEVRAPEAVILLTAFQLLLAAHGSGPDLAVGTPVNVRGKVAAGAVGHHTNVLPIRARIDPRESFRTLVRRVRDTYFGALMNAVVPEEDIARLVPRTADNRRPRLTRHLFNYFPLQQAQFRIGGLDARPLVIDNGFSKYDLEFFVASADDGIDLVARFATDVLDRDDVVALLHRYEALLTLFGETVDTPTGELAVWSATDHAVIEAANESAHDIPFDTVVAAVRHHALATPTAVAIHDETGPVTYRQLWFAASAAARRLHGAGARPGDVVAIAAARDATLIANALGVWLCGAGYLPIDPEHPAHRVQHVLRDSGARIVLADHPVEAAPDRPVTVMALHDAHGTDAPPDGPLPAVPHEPGPDERAYLIYTSGSTGRPKGVSIRHRSIANAAAHYVDILDATRTDVTLWLTTFAFDMANLEMYVPLYSGGQIAVAPDEARSNGVALRAAIERHQPHILQATPTTWRIVLDQVADQLDGRRVVTGAEIVQVDIARRLLDTGCELHHAYGPTETTTWATWARVDRIEGDRLDVGGPIWNTYLGVAAEDGRQLPVGVRGEVWIAGDGVALGYHERDDLNAERFGTHPVYGRFYRTGDVGRWRSDGTIELFGRSDRQIKLRGNRIELGEVEAALLSHPEVRAVAVVAVGDRSADARLVAFVETSGDADISATLWEHARAELPHASIPQEFHPVDALPVNANEKVDYPRLEQLAGHVHRERAAAPSHPDLDGPAPDGADPLVTRLVGHWRAILGHDEVDADANFFTSGGHSLAGAQLLQQIQDDIGVPLKLADLFDAPTPAGLAARVRELDAEPAV